MHRRLPAKHTGHWFTGLWWLPARHTRYWYTGFWSPATSSKVPVSKARRALVHSALVTSYQQQGNGGYQQDTHSTGAQGTGSYQQPGTGGYQQGTQGTGSYQQHGNGGYQQSTHGTGSQDSGGYQQQGTGGYQQGTHGTGTQGTGSYQQQGNGGYQQSTHGTGVRHSRVQQNTSGLPNVSTSMRGDPPFIRIPVVKKSAGKQL